MRNCAGSLILSLRSCHNGQNYEQRVNLCPECPDSGTNSGRFRSQYFQGCPHCPEVSRVAGNRACVDSRKETDRIALIREDLSQFESRVAPSVFALAWAIRPGRITTRSN